MAEQYLETTDESQVPRRAYRSGDRSFVINDDGSAAMVSADSIFAAQDAAISQLGWEYVGTFTDGFTLEARNQYVTDGANNYKWAGDLPVTVVPGSTPESAGGISAVGWSLIKLDSASNVLDETGTNVQEALDALNQRSLAPMLTQFCQGRVARILYTGTSIEASSASAFRAWFESLKHNFGDSGNYTQVLASLGGNYTNVFDGWYKQPFSGLRKHRIRGDSSSTAITLRNRSVRKIVIRYSTESDGGSFDVDVDGVFHATIDCNGPQSMANEVVINFNELGYHTVTLHPPASGYAYVETIDWCQDRPGIHVMDGAYGGSMLQNYVKDRIPTGAQVDPVPVEGDVGLEALFNNQSAHSKPDLIILPYTVNDAGRGVGEIEAYAIPALNKIIDYARNSGVHVLVCCEIGGHYSMPVSTHHAGFNAMRQALLATKVHPHVTLIDWHYLSGMASADESMLAVLADRYYNATNVDIAAGTFDGDFIHPNSLGNAPLGDALHTLSGTTPLVELGTNLTSDPAWYESATTLAQNASMNDRELVGQSGIVRYHANQLGVVNQYALIGSVINPISRLQEPLWFCSDELKYEESFSAQIAASGDEDQYGKYLDLSNATTYTRSPIGLADPTRFATYTVMVGAGSRATIRINQYDNSAAMPVVINGDVIDTGVSVTAGHVFLNDTDKPTFFSITVPLTDPRQFVVFTGRLYGMWITATDFACMPGKSIEHPKYLSSPQVPGTSRSMSDVIVGQEYIDGGISKLALRDSCVNVKTRSVESLYRCTDTSNRDLMLLNGTLTETGFSQRIGGMGYSTNQNPVWQSTRLISDADAGKKMGIVLPGIKDTGRYRAYLFTGSANRYIGLDESGVWAVAANGNTTPDTVSPNNSDCYRGMPIFIPITLPDDASIFDGYSNYRLCLRYVGGTVDYPKFVSLCDGVLATV